MSNYNGKFQGAPQSGRVFAYTTEKLIFDAYRLQDGRIVLRSGEELNLDGIYQLHLFNADVEFRIISEKGVWKTSVMRADDEPENDIDHFVFSETQFLKERYCIDSPDEKIVVNNYFSFDEEGFLRLTGYRLAMEK